MRLNLLNGIGVLLPLMAQARGNSHSNRRNIQPLPRRHQWPTRNGVDNNGIANHLSLTTTIAIARGGFANASEERGGSTTPLPPVDPNPKTKPAPIAAAVPQDKTVLLGSVAAIGVASALTYRYRIALRPLLDKQFIQEQTLSILNRLEQSPGSIPLYILGMAMWEFLGLSTIPVETAAGMVFGPTRGVLASGTGKLLGAYTAFSLGRGLLARQVRNKLQRNPVWSVLDRSTDVHSPLVVALLMKFSCFPEFVKNFGSACLAIPFSTFATATALHGLTFTALWTMLGVDAAARLEQPDLGANVPLQVSLVLAALVGLVGSPLLMAWWIRDMKRIAAGRRFPK